MKKQSGAGAARRLSLLAAALALGLAACGGGGGGLEDLVVGDCIKFVANADTEDDGQTVDFEKVECSADGFKMQVATIDPTDGCPADYVEYGTEDYGVCVAPLLEVGTCYAPDEVAEWVVADCTGADAWFKVEKELSGTDTAECTDADGHFVLPEPAPGKVYCTVAPA